MGLHTVFDSKRAMDIQKFVSERNSIRLLSNLINL